MFSTENNPSSRSKKCTKKHKIFKSDSDAPQKRGSDVRTRKKSLGMGGNLIKISCQGFPAQNERELNESDSSLQVRANHVSCSFLFSLFWLRDKQLRYQSFNCGTKVRAWLLMWTIFPLFSYSS